MNLLLIGPRGCGKTTVGRLLATRTGRRFVDLDATVLAMFGMSSISEVWAERGEAAWRDAEAVAILKALETDRQIIALGGGTPMIDAVRAAIHTAQMAGHAKVAYLSCSVEELARRLGRDPGDRPALTGSGLIQEIRTILARRESTYRALADVVCDVTNSTPEDAAAQLTGFAKS